ncbi:Sugar tr and/or MFS 1 domain containing protein [Asbolus verrucosus]|uniref:Sugar tr and/or MFS 1 domain containing protein n=1 Tax=Asbolus verrucosus TaxID=1661398 RepID=A0A482W5V1_ASBVE|nr:Sugar tr and/or MFS 1 domain containing protein [Asbolus verrucosus]
MLSSGVHEAWTSVYIPQMLNGTNTIQITSDEGSWITISMGLGGLIGCIITSFLTDTFGRKKTILLTAFPNFIASLLLAYANSVIVFCVARIISGVASGMTIAVIPHYLGEIADPKIRGTLGTIIPIFNLVGFLFINIVGTYLTITVSSLVSSVFPVLLLLTFAWMPESPYYLIMKGNFDGAQKSLKKLKGVSDVLDELNRLKETVVKQIGNRGKIVELFTKKSNRNALLIVFILLNGKQFTGIGPIDAYAQLIFQQIFDNLSPLLITLIYYMTRLIMVIVSSFFADRIGRRPILIVSFFGCAVTLFLLAIYLYMKSHTTVDVTEYRILPILFLEGFAVFYSFLTSVPLTILGELFPMNVKVFASIFYQTYLYIITAVVIKLFQLMTDNFGMEMSFFVFAISCVFHLILIFQFVLETKGQSLEEIQDCLHKSEIKSSR